jgi:hypothetical protein
MRVGRGRGCQYAGVPCRAGCARGSHLAASGGMSDAWDVHGGLVDVGLRVLVEVEPGAARFSRARQQFS